MADEIKKSKRGGFRPNAGRPKGSRSAATLKKQEVLEEVLQRAMDGSETPLEVMLNIMRDPETETAMRFEAAKAAAPYVHPRLSQVDSTVTHKQAPDEYTDAELAAYLSRDSRPGIAYTPDGPQKPN
jgi:hypothetical protein